MSHNSSVAASLKPELPKTTISWNAIFDSNVNSDPAGMILLANVLQAILHKVLQKAKVKIFRFCNSNKFSKDYFRSPVSEFHP